MKAQRLLQAASDVTVVMSALIQPLGTYLLLNGSRDDCHCLASLMQVLPRARRVLLGPTATRVVCDRDVDQ